MTQNDANYMIKKLDDIDPSNEDPSIRNEINAIKDIYRGIKKNLEVIESKPNDNKIKNNKNEFNQNIEMKEISNKKDKSISNEDEDFYKTNKPRINSKTKKKSKKRKNSRNSEQYMDKKICIEGCIGCNIV